ncbi:HAMP domain-containing sensor histidine kinase [Actinomadura sp. DC4]|uniref:sensor histidine kinase n=1 Tax=Actinomadura sp. DC4 TaxID=3055069 RepID=UPI0025B066EC|nr:HAMP domain-containing sensor histidine kinase [Actinomadura sp. DC4]MDN3352456.1 HAMP domain-containing sensor histidine kinase [Actinomadura sp. DC4]
MTGNPPAGRPLRRRVLVAIVGVAASAVVLFAIPLAVALQRLYRDEAIVSLERDATRISAVVPDDIARRPKPVPQVTRVARRLSVGVYTLDGRRVTGRGPTRSRVAGRAADGEVHESVEHGLLTVSAPVPSDESIVAVIRVATPYRQVTARAERAWLFMGALAVLVVGLAAVVARRQAGRLAAPLEGLTRDAQALGGGDFSIRARTVGVREADAASRALEATARRLGGVLQRERDFSAHVSHQLRTPLTGLLLGLEAGLAEDDPRAVIRTALERGEHLQEIIEDLVRLSRGSAADRGVLDVPALLDEVRSRADVTVHVPDGLPEVRASAAAVRQIVHVLLDNAATHGRPPVTVSATDLGNGIAIDVADTGPGIPEGADVFRAPADGHGIGLALARSLAEAEGGRLIIRRSAPPTFSLLLPVAGYGSRHQPTS